MLFPHAPQVLSAGGQSVGGESERVRVAELHHSLMQLEIQLVDQLEVGTLSTVPV